MIKTDYKIPERPRASIFLTFILLLCGLVSNAQNLSAVKGVVTDGKGAALPGVTVGVKGTKTLMSTGADGKFTINASANSTLIFRYIGFDTKEIVVGNQTNINVSLTESSNALKEVDVVSVGYGTKRKIDLTGTVNTLGGDDIVASKATNATEALQGRLQGVDARRGSGKPGSDFVIDIRGVNTINGNNNPLFVIDGIPMTNNVNNPLNDINPADIERMDVLKDASSTAIYGSRGANGVIIVTTKKGNKGITRINYDAYAGIVNPYNLPPDMNGSTFVNYARDYYNGLAQANALLSNPQQPTPAPIADNKIFSATELSNIASGNYTNWVNLIKHNGLTTNHNLSITGGDDKTVYFMSAGFQNYQGGTKVENVKKYTLKVGLDKTLNNTFRFGAAIYNTYNDINTGTAEGFRSAYRLRPTGSAYNADGSLRFLAYEGESQITNPLFDLVNDIHSQQYIHVFPNIYGQITFLKGLTFKSSFSPDITFQRTGVYDDQFTKQNAGTKPASGSNGKNNYFNYTFTNLLSYTNEIGKSKFDITLGNEFDFYQQDNSFINVTGLPYRSLWYNVGSTVPATINGVTIQPTTTVGSGYTQQNIQSYFARANYTFNDKYLFTVTGRADQNSIFAPGHQWGYFPSAAFAWRISQENFLKDVTAINNLKLRLTAGKVGNAALQLNPAILYPYVTQSTIGITQYNFGGSNANGFAPNILANKDLTWEKTTEYDAGIDLDILKSRISLQADYYNKTVKGAIVGIQIPSANGFGGVTANSAVVRNSGIELGLNTVNIRNNKFTWTSNFNFSHNHNEIKDIYGNGTNDVGNQKFIGQKVRVVYAYKIIGVWQQSEAAEAAKYKQVPGQYKIQDITNSGLNTGVPTAANLSPDGKIDPVTDRQIIGSSLPQWFGGMTNTFKYQNFDFSVVLYTRQGTLEQSVFLNQVMNGDQGRARFGAFDRSYWTPDNASNTWANPGREQDGGRRSIAEWSNSSYTKISNITLGYTLPKNVIQKLKIKSLRVYVDAYNPFIFTKFVGWDPENPTGDSNNNQDFRTRTLILGVNLSL